MKLILYLGSVGLELTFHRSPIAMLIMVLLQGLCYVVDITMVFLTFIGIFVHYIYLDQEN